MTTIRDRILARRDLDEARAARDVTTLAEKLNEECQLADVPQQVTAAAILDLAPFSSVLMGLLRAAAVGESVADRAAALLSDEGATVMVQAYVPPFVDQVQAAEEMYFPDGTER
jgi:hypothetical protein